MGAGSQRSENRVAGGRLSRRGRRDGRSRGRRWRWFLRRSGGRTKWGRQCDRRVCLWQRGCPCRNRCRFEGRGRGVGGRHRGWRHHGGGRSGRCVQLGSRESLGWRLGVGTRRNRTRNSCTWGRCHGQAGDGRVLRRDGRLRRLREEPGRSESVGHGRNGGARRLLKGRRLQGRRRGSMRRGCIRLGTGRLSGNRRGGLCRGNGSRGLGAIRGRGHARGLRRCQGLSSRGRRWRGDVAGARGVDGSRLLGRWLEGTAFEAQRLECAETSCVRERRRFLRLFARDGLFCLYAGALAESPAIATKSTVGTARGTSPLTDIRLIVHALPSKVRPILTRRDCAYRAMTPARVFLPRRRTAKRENRKRSPIDSPTSVTFTLLQ